MNHKIQALGALLAAAVAVMAAPVQAQDAAAVPTLRPTPGKAACVVVPTTVADKALRAELCVTGGSFSHDVYQLKLDGALVLKGIDDETTKGLRGTRDGKAVTLVCAPQNIPPKASAEDIQRIVPGYPADKTKELVELMSSGFSSVELGRQCKASLDEAPVLTVQVLFE